MGTAALSRSVDDSAIAAPLEPGNVPQFPGVIGTFMGRDALSLSVAYLDLGPEDTVLLPVYTCQEVIRQFVNSTKVVFYDVRPDLTIDPDEVMAKLKSNRVKMMLITNYFGFLQPYRQEIRRICCDQNISLIEDCAHSLLTQGSGETGDLAFYSFRKILPLRDGGGLKIRMGKPLQPAYHRKTYSNLISLFIAGKSLLRVRGTALSRASLMSHTARIAPAAAALKQSRVLPLSSFAHEQIKRTSLSEVIERRRSDFLFWQRACSDKSHLATLFADLPTGVCPLGYPISVKNRESIESKARSAGIPLSVHWRLDPSCGTECVTSHRLTKQLLTLPLYPEVGIKEREAILGILQQSK